MRRSASRLIVLTAVLLAGCSPESPKAPPADVAKGDPGIRPEPKGRGVPVLKKKRRPPGPSMPPRDAAVAPNPDL